MIKIRLLYTYRNKNNGNVIRIHSKLTSPDWELVEGHDKATDTAPEETGQDDAEPAAETAPEEFKETDTAPAEKPEAASAAAKKKATTTSKKTTGKKV